jgi:hypothetical protein
MIILPGTGRGTAARSAVVEGVCRICTDECGCSVSVPEYFRGGYSEHSIPSFHQKGASQLIALRLVAALVCLPVDFDDETRSTAVEIDDVRINRVLLSEAQSTGRASKPLP